MAQTITFGFLKGDVVTDGGRLVNIGTVRMESGPAEVIDLSQTNGQFSYSLVPTGPNKLIFQAPLNSALEDKTVNVDIKRGSNSFRIKVSFAKASSP